MHNHALLLSMGGTKHLPPGTVKEKNTVSFGIFKAIQFAILIYLDISQPNCFIPIVAGMPQHAEKPETYGEIMQLKITLLAHPIFPQAMGDANLICLLSLNAHTRLNLLDS